MCFDGINSIAFDDIYAYSRTYYNNVVRKKILMKCMPSGVYEPPNQIPSNL